MRFARAVGNDPPGEMPVSAIWSAEVQEALLRNIDNSVLLQSLHARFMQVHAERVGRRERSNAQVSASIWQQVSSHLHGQVLGYVVLQPEFVKQDWTLLDESCQQIRDFWMFTVHHSRPLIFCEVQRATLGDEPVPVHSGNERTVSRQSRSWFFNVSDGSFKTLNAKFPSAAEFSTNLALYLPVSHAILILMKEWTRCGLPQVLRGRGSGAWAAGRGILGAIQAEAPVQAEGEVAQFDADWVQDPKTILRLMHNFQRFLLPFVQLGEGLLAETRRHIQVLQRLRDNMLLESVRLSKSMYEVTYLAECVLLAADLKAAQNLQPVLLRSLRLVIRDPAVRSFYERMLRETHTVPSRSLLLHHRMTVHLGYMRVPAAFLDSMLDETRQAPGLVRWSTMDASPHKGYEFVLQGHCTMALQDLPEATRRGMVLLSSRSTEEERCASFEYLRRKLQLVPGVPVAVGSGRSALPYKINAAAHATRLESNSWSQVAMVMNSTFSWTGDLGTESHICSWKGSLTDLFGEWILSGEFEDEPGFQFENVGAAEAGALADEQDSNNLVFDVVPCEAAPVSQDFRESGVRIDFTHQVFIAGMLHITQNMSKSLDQALVYWNTFLPQLSHVCKLLSQPWSRRRFIQTCLDRPPRSARKHEFEAFHAAVYAGRWGSKGFGVLKGLVGQ